MMKQCLVRFDLWCGKCKHNGKDQFQDPCNRCLSEPFRYGTRKPINWEEKRHEHDL